MHVPSVTIAHQVLWHVARILDGLDQQVAGVPSLSTVNNFQKEQKQGTPASQLDIYNLQ